MSKRDDFDISSYSVVAIAETEVKRWTEDERIALFWLEIWSIKNLIYETPFKGATTVYKQETVDAYWDELMTRMPEGREPEYKAN